MTAAVRLLAVLLVLASPALGQVTQPAARPDTSARSSSGGVARLGIAAVGDSTITLRIGDATWLERNQRGIVVDPGNNDALVARFRLISVNGDSAIAVLTGLTGPVQRTHAAIVEHPRRVAAREQAEQRERRREQWYSRPLFWAGAAAGAFVGLVVGTML